MIYKAQQGFAFKAQPATTSAYEVDCTDIADLSEDDGRRDLDIALADLACGWEDLARRCVEPPSRRVAKQLIAAGYVAITVPSLAPGAARIDRNIVLWQLSDVLPHKVLIVDDEAHLPRDGRSWASWNCWVSPARTRPISSTVARRTREPRPRALLNWCRQPDLFT